MRNSYTLWSLMDMLKVYAKEYIDLGRAIEEAAEILYIAEQSDGEQRNLSKEEKEKI